MEYYSSDADAAEWLASISGDYIPDAAEAAEAPALIPDTPPAAVAVADPPAEVIEVPFGEEASSNELEESNRQYHDPNNNDCCPD